MPSLKDVFVAVQADAKAIQDDQAALAAAGAKLDADTKQFEVDKAALGNAVKSTGGFYSVNADGTATAVEPDGNGGYVTRNLLPDSTEVPAAPPAG